MEDWNTSGIYMLTCKINGKRYIGQAQNIAKRMYNHKCSRHKYYEQVIVHAIVKYGWENFDKTVLEFCPIEKLDEREIFWIAKLKPEYNISSGGVSRRGYKLSKKTREKLSEVAKVRWQNPKIRNIFQKPVVCIETQEVFESISDAARKIGIYGTSISRCLRGKGKTAGGYHWDYLIKENNNHKVNDNDETSKTSRKSKRTNKYLQKQVICIDTGEIFESVKIAAENIGIRPALISKALNGILKTAGGFRWKLANAETSSEDFYNDKRKKSITCVETGKIFSSLGEAIKYLGLKHHSSLSNVLCGNAKTAGGYHWKYTEEID